MYQMTQNPSWEVRTFPYNFRLLHFHSSNILDHFYLVYSQNQPCADVRNIFLISCLSEYSMLLPCKVRNDAAATYSLLPTKTYIICFLT